MGHYAAEMMCNKCGNLRCTCPVKIQKPKTGWVVTGDFRVITTEEDNKTYSKFPSSLYLHQMQRAVYKKREEAEKAALTLCEEAVETQRKHLYELKRILKTERPWEKK